MTVIRGIYVFFKIPVAANQCKAFFLKHKDDVK